ncbi:hypothetical protein K1Y78_64375, partial [Streptomyces sp. tea 10]|nr:hypothetical protein [Streptomyces sp. tea 10]
MELADDITYSVHDVEDAVAAHALQLENLTQPAHRHRVIECTRGWYLPAATEDELDAALSRLESSPVWIPRLHGTRADLARLKNMTSQLIGRFAMSAVPAHALQHENLTQPAHRHRVIECTRGWYLRA